jgi:uncharacterized membrane protein YkoI
MKPNILSGTLLASLLLCLGLAASWATPATASDEDHVEARALLRAGKILPLARILATVQKRVPGDVIEVDLDHEDRGWEYDVKVLTPAGRVRKVTLDAKTGVVLKIKDD